MPQDGVLGIQQLQPSTCPVPAGVLITVLGNLFVVFAVSYFKLLHLPPTSCCFPWPWLTCFQVCWSCPQAVRSVESCWFFGDSLCRLHTYLDTLFCLTSILHLCFISIDRHCAICEPLLYPSKFTVRVALRYILAGRVPTLTQPIYTDVAEGAHLWLEEMPCVGSCCRLCSISFGAG